MSKRAILSKIRSFKPFSKKSNQGFTLIELLIAVTIIAILVSVGAVSFTKAQAQGRDAQRLADLSIIQSALEQYQAENGVYPETVNETLFNSKDLAPWIPGLERYISKGVPVDPFADDVTTPFYYMYVDANEQNTYILWVGLENPHDEQLQDYPGDFDLTDGGNQTLLNPPTPPCGMYTPPAPPHCVIFTGPITD